MSDDFWDTHEVHEFTRHPSLNGIRVDIVKVNVYCERRLNGVLTRLYSDRRARVVREETGDVLLDTGVVPNHKCNNMLDKFLKKQVTLDAILYGQKLDTPS